MADQNYDPPHDNHETIIHEDPDIVNDNQLDYDETNANSTTHRTAINNDMDDQEIDKENIQQIPTSRPVRTRRTPTL